MPHLLDKYSDLCAKARTVKVNGRITQVIGLVIESEGPAASIGEICTIEFNGILVGRAEVVGFKEAKTLLMPLGEMTGIRPGLDVVATGRPLKISVDSSLLGRVIDGLGNPLDGKGPIQASSSRAVFSTPPSPLTRRRIAEPMVTGIRSIDSFLTLGKGQRVGIFAGSGVGKSVMLGMIARNCLAKVNVIALIGERGREVREFIERDLGEEGLKRSVVVVATSDQPALIRLKGALTATTIAEYFRAEGNDVMLLMDSSTRIAMAQREIGLATGEPPATKGYTPSVFAFLPRLMERAGTSDKGSITGLYTVLVEGDDLDEPIADAMRSILDGHIVLSRALAQRNHYPAIDVLGSISRVMPDVIEKEHLAAARRLLTLMAEYRGAEDLITIGAYAKGSNPEVDRAITIMKDMNSFLCQAVGEKASMSEAIVTMKQLVEKVT
ncbi:MAG: flagellar protein export ATPase FliI [Candidatus Raymondbacteria bacterium RifOxyA12_full_50_37]|uniref:Flagellar protein export ATPase FliI n=1 Tax=Candidatus Raymondbacteria bacterium RIFOXYD12_FULL_49_13 TaxID=1817890 RepID=A0A1F7EZS9_UNCRA|nr:MAG: flagellar protein export ATPase FliI [Candidatus Raymondbacteria bacterium RifOxyA12_full_50_37]OGJ99909.1 MAG: flagellar protein export ATPase FliI [Candidatus Raymondbacteria bacterium RIFOXYD12_FULL_49_13]OGP40792.1 MAG: flagellar protein export ATPase FliI [Candidatus Raymondbacteria bacterium RIFOXYB2_FULL_49_35]